MAKVPMSRAGLERWIDVSREEKIELFLAFLTSALILATVYIIIVYVVVPL